MSAETTPRAPAITVTGLSKGYRLYRQPSDRLKEMFWRRPRHEMFWALRKIDLAVPPGQVLGLIGANGSGKSTLLQLIAGVLQPTRGTVATRGRITALLELGAGFNPEFTGRENAVLNAALLGLSEAETRERLPQILRFAEIGDFIDRPVKTYSSGMYVRLAFAIAVSVDPDILIVDEALAVGDAYFQHRCTQRMHQFRAAGKTIIVVSHDTAAVKALCDRVVLLHQGRVLDDGQPERVVAHYLTLLEGQAFEQASEAAPGASPARAVAGPADERGVEWEIPNIDARHGSGAARIIGLACYDEAGHRSDALQVGEVLTVRVSVRFEAAVERPSVGFVLRDRLGADLAGTSTAIEGVSLPPATAGTIYTVRLRMFLPPLHPGNYALSPTVADGDRIDYVMCDWIENARSVQIGGLYRTGCAMHPKVTVELQGVEEATATVSGAETRG